MIKAKSLSIQIWLWFIGCIGISGVIIAFIIFSTLESNLKEQLYNDIEAQQQVFTLQTSEATPSQPITMSTTKASPTSNVKHIVTDENYMKAQPLIPSTEAIPTEGDSMAVRIRRNEGENMYSVISAYEVDNEKKYIYSYAIQNMRIQVFSKFWYVFLAIFIVLLIMFIPAHIISKRLTKPLKTLETEMGRIAKRQWNEPIHLKGSQEFDNLTESCEYMRQQLITYDNKQQDMLQSISHELKTPIMVIRSYIQAAKDGFFPKGNLETTLDAMDNEADGLQKKVLDLIYVTNLDYLATHYAEIKQEDVYLDTIIEEVYERLQYKRTDIKWKLDLEDILIKGDQEQWKVVFENILQNGLRYSKNEIKISLKETNQQAICRIYNNGPSIDVDKKDKLFNIFEKGIQGESGLGLNIVKRIIDLYDGKVWVENEEDGVAFYIAVPI